MKDTYLDIRFPTDNFMKYEMKTNPNKIILEILRCKMKTRDLK